MICATVTEISGQAFLVPMTPQPAVVTGCAYIIQSGTEVTSNPFLMTPTEALELGGAIALLWVTVGVLKTVSRRS